MPQAQIVHQALLQAGLQDRADRFALDYIVGPLNRAGFFHTLLREWLPVICQSSDPAVRSEALGQFGKQLLHIGDYDTALDYLKQSLVIRQQIGDLSGLCATLFNIGHIHAQKEEWQEAVSAWLAVYDIAKRIGNAQALQALSDLAPRLGLPPGLDGWEMLWQKSQK